MVGRSRWLVLAVALVAAPAFGQAQTQTTGSYSFYWTLAGDASNTPITSTAVVPGSTLTVRFWVRETGGNIFSTSGLGGYDANFTFDPSRVTFAPPPNQSTTTQYANARTNPYPSGGFDGTSSGIRNSQVATINSTGTTGNFSRSVSIPNDGTDFVKDTLGPNTAGSILLTELQFDVTMSNPGTFDLVGQQSTGTTRNFAYLDPSNARLFLDNTSTTQGPILIGTQTAVLTVTVTPEPGTVFGLAALGLAAVRAIRRASS